MKRFIVSALFVIAIVSMLGPLNAAGKDQKVLLIIRDGESQDLELMLTKEVGIMKDKLEQADFQVQVATSSGVPLVAGKARVQPDLKFADVKAADFAGIILPCMAIGSVEEPVPPNPITVALVKEAVAAGKPVAAQLGGVETLAKAGVLSQKRYAYFSEEWVEATPVLEGGTYSGSGVVRDGNIVTSGICPLMAKTQGLQDGTEELTAEFIAALSGK